MKNLKDYLLKDYLLKNYLFNEEIYTLKGKETDIKLIDNVISDEAYFTKEQLFGFLNHFKGFKDEGGFEKENNSTLKCKINGKKYIIDIKYVKQYTSYQIMNYLQINAF